MTDVIEDMPNPTLELSSKKIVDESTKRINGKNLIMQVDAKFKYNLNESSSDSLNDTDDFWAEGDDIFDKNALQDGQRNDEDLKKAVIKRVKNRELKLNHLNVGDDFAESMGDILKKDNNLQKIQLSDNKITTRGAIAIFNKISNSWYFLDISNNPEIKKDAYKFLGRYVLKDYRK